MATGKTGGSSLRSKLSNTLLGVIIFFSATQLGLHFWPPSSLVYGIRVDYLSPTLYFLDLLIILFLSLQGLTLKEVPNPAGSKAGKVRPYWNLIPILLLNLLYSANPLSTLSWSLHFLLYLLFFAVLGSDLKGSVQPADSMAGRSDPKVIITAVLPLTLLFQLLLAAGQVYLGHSIGGLMYYLGERTIAVGQPAVALGTFMDSVVLRAYGTFGHPNVLAGWLVISLLILLRFKPTTKYQILYTAITACGVALTQSRSALIALFGLIIPFYLIKNLKLRFLFYFITLLLYYSLAPSLLSTPRSDLSLSQRLDLQGQSLKVISRYPIFGTGAQASISTYPALPLPKPRGGGGLQPDHNSFTLFLSWFGLFGVLAILYSLRQHYHLSSIVSRLAPLLPLLLLDHYFLTSPQGLFIILLLHILTY